ncbi:MFS transporter [Kutzneria sp. CA-103260]|uniref:MFS transporter n=1 Tax=Kutzneria sp. CA-103260 TaxID=2802641 RepID=UPI001BA594C1|nr:MFS transporter [Kutzneria sp. CA-103260]QUQ66018.1 major facilitator superfamily protein [Kutzneria sp. CA-103260]
MSSQTITRTRRVDDTFARSGTRRGGTAQLLLLASMVVTLLAASSAPTPIYAIYQAEWGFSPITTTIVFGIYAISVLASLLTLGKLSDHVGRKPVLLVALVVQALTMIILATAGGVPALLIGRLVQGITTGAAIGAIGAAMLDIDAKRGQLTNALVPGIGTATGALLSALLVTFLPAPTHLVYYVLLAVFLAQALGVAFLRETVTRAPGALASLKPEISLPRAVRAHVMAAAPVLFAVWALAGLYGALGPALIGKLIGGNNAVLAGVLLVAFAGVASIAVLVLRNLSPVAVMLTGTSALFLGVAVTLVALGVGSLALFFVGTVIAGAGFGGGFQGGIRIVVPQVAPHERAGVLSLLYVVSYLGFGLPAVAAGFLVVDGPGLIGATQIYGGAVLVLSVLALAALVRARRR